MTAWNPASQERIYEMPTSPEWAALTRIPIKAQLYERETYFREGLADAIEVMANRVYACLQRAALLIVKPDGLVSGKTPIVARFLRANGFSISAVELPAFTQFHWRELWRYQLTCATLDRLAVNDLVLRDQALLLLLRYDGDLDVPASVRLSGLKGPSDISQQPPGCLRRLLAQPNRVLSFIHVADEPADVLRELAIMLDEPARRRVLAAFADGAISASDQDVLDEALATSQCAVRVLDPQVSLRRAEEALRRAAGQEPSDRAAEERVLADLQRMGRGERISWRDFARALTAAGAQLDRWDMATLGASFIVYDEPGASKLIQAVDAKLWHGNQEPITAL